MREIDGKIQLMLVGNDIVAEEGEYVTVVGGVIIGVYTGALPSRQDGFTNVRLPKAAAKPLALPAPTPSRSDAVLRSDSWADRLTPAIVFDAFRKLNRTVNAQTVSDTIGIPLKDFRARQKVWRLISVLVAAGQLSSNQIRPGVYEYALTPKAVRSGDLLPQEAQRFTVKQNWVGKSKKKRRSDLNGAAEHGAAI